MSSVLAGDVTARTTPAAVIAAQLLVAVAALVLSASGVQAAAG